MCPVGLAGVHVQAVQEAAEVGIEQQPVVDGAGRNRAADFVVMPEAAKVSDVAALGRVNRVEVPDSLTVLWVLPVGNEHLVLPDYRRRDHLIARLWPNRILRVQVEFPELLAG